MIARIWHRAVPIGKGEEYLRLTREHAIPDYRSSPAKLGAWLRYREEGVLAHVVTLSHWRHLDALRSFAGDGVEAAKYYPYGEEFLVEFEPIVIHYKAFDT